MVFVTVGTHEQQFDRLVKAVDDLKATGRSLSPSISRRVTRRTSPSTAPTRSSCRFDR